MEDASLLLLLFAGTALLLLGADTPLQDRSMPAPPRPLARSRSHVILTGTGSQEPAATKADRAKNAAVFRMQVGRWWVVVGFLASGSALS